MATEDPYAVLRISERGPAPFVHFLADRCFAPAVEQALLAFLEGDAPWKLAETDFYEQYEFDMLDAVLPPALYGLRDAAALRGLRETVGAALGAELGDEIQLVAHKLVPGQRIAIHNDLRENGETHRLTIQLNRGLSDEAGGFFMLFNSDDPADIHRILRPVSNSALGFAIGPHSHHAVSRLHQGERYTLVYSFYAHPR